ncbi:MAG: type II secretion system F family protein [Patescibacteria group bacterium]
MATLRYRAKTSDGHIQAGIIEAENTKVAQEALIERNMEVISLEPYKENVGSFDVMSIFNRISTRDLVVVSRTLSVMVSASVPLTEALRNISRQTENPKLRKLLTGVAEEVEGGGRLSDALERYPKVFSGFFVNMIRSGETSGQLSEVLEYLADQQEKDFDLAAKLKGAMIYPSFILSAMFVVGFIMMSFVVPKLVAVLKEANVELPITTRMLIATSNFFESFWWLVLIIIVALIIGIRVFVKTPEGKFFWDSIVLRIPVFGKLFQRVYVVRFSRSLATLIKGGVDMVSALEIVADVMENEVWRRLVYDTIREVNDGNPLTTAFEHNPIVPTMMVQMLAVGESTGQTHNVLLRLSSFFSREIDNLVANLVAMIEPIILIVLGLGVGVMVSAILLPLYNMSSV